MDLNISETETTFQGVLFLIGLLGTKPSLAKLLDKTIVVIKLGGLHFFLDGIWGALKCQKMTLGGGGGGGLQVPFK